MTSIKFDPERLDKFLGLNGFSNPSETPENSQFATSAMLKRLRKELEELFRKEMKLQMDDINRMVERKCSAVLGKASLSILKSKNEQISILRKELEVEREKRKEDKQNFVDCVDKLLEEIVELGVKDFMLEERMGEVEKWKSGVPVTSLQPVSSVPQETLKDIETKLQELTESQKSFQTEMEAVKQDLKCLNYTVMPPVEAIFEAAPVPPLGTPMMDLVKWGYESLSEIPSHYVETEGSTAINYEMDEDDEVKLSITPSPRKFPSTNNNGDIDIDDEGHHNDEELTVIHEMASTVGRYLPFLCQCGLEFDSEGSLGKHVMEQTNESMNSIPSDFKSAIDRASSKLPFVQTPVKSKYGSFQQRQNPTKPSSRMWKAFQLSQNRKQRKEDTATSKRPPFSSQIKCQLLQANGSSFNPPLSSQHATGIKHEHGIGKQVRGRAGNSRFYCKCGRGFSSKQRLDRHTHLILNGKRFKCNFCSSSYLRFYRLKDHTRTKHKVDLWKGRISCDQCRQQFDNRKELMDHRSLCHTF